MKVFGGCGSIGGRTRRQNYLIILYASFIILFLNAVDGLQCYECLSLYCRSGSVCESIKRTMQEIFVPKSHILSFDPRNNCPEEEDPTSPNSTKWEGLSRECERSDSVCLVTPIEVTSTVDGSKDGKQLESETQLSTTGYLRGCASRRKLQEQPETIHVHASLKEAQWNKGRNNNNTRATKGVVGVGAGRPITTSQDVELELDLFKLKFEDGYEIRRVYSHDFYIDQGTENATKCYMDRCNTKVRVRSGGTRIRAARDCSIMLILLGYSVAYPSLSLFPTR